jgi:hypothetical protein
LALCSIVTKSRQYTVKFNTLNPTYQRTDQIASSYALFKVIKEYLRANNDLENRTAMRRRCQRTN